MRKLKNSYWNKFTHLTSSGKQIRDGLKFEDLIEELLRLEYGKAWKRTGKSHDFNRDFHLATDGILEWAECKNYQEPIALDTIAPTLVMAQIFEVNTILFFSYSPINKSAKSKIYSFKKKAQKNVYIYDEQVLDELILKHKRDLPPKFRPQPYHIIRKSSEKLVFVDISFIRTPILGSTLDDRDLQSLETVEKIDYNTVFEIVFLCINESLSDDYEFYIRLHPDFYEDNRYYNIVDCQYTDIDKMVICKRLQAASGDVIRLRFKTNVFRRQLYLPIFKVEIRKAGKVIDSFTTARKLVQNNWVGTTPLLGENYRKIIARLNSYILNNDRLSCMLITGFSGTGKTRLLREALDNLIKFRYRVVSFIGNEKDSVEVIFRELIYFLYEVPRREILQYLEDDILCCTEGDKTKPSYKAYRLASKFSEHQTDEELIQIIETDFDILYEKMSREKIALVIDNVQFFGKPMTHFLYKYVEYGKQQSCKNLSVLVLTVNNDFSGSDTEQLVDYAKEIEKDRPEFKIFKISGFETELNGILFLRELLHVNNDYLVEEFKKIIAKASLNPFCLYQSVYYLYEAGALGSDNDNHSYIISNEIFLNVVERMPDGVQEIIKKRWLAFLARYQLEEETCYSILGMVQILGILSQDQIRHLHLDISVVEQLSKHAFLLQREDKKYQFFHDIIETFFSAYCPQMYLYAVHVLSLQRSERIKEQNIFAYYFSSIFQKNVSEEALMKLCPGFLETNMAHKLAWDYYDRLFSLVLGFQNHDIRWLETLVSICSRLKTLLGLEKSLEYYEKMNEKLNSSTAEELFTTTAFRNYMNAYADLLFHLKRHKDAITYLKSVKQRVPQSDSDSFYALCAMIDNRLLINHREFRDSYHSQQAEQCLKNAWKYTNKITDSHLRDEFTYLNLSDEGYNYYCLAKDKERLLEIWEQCLQFPPERLPEKAMNYYRKKIQIALINQTPHVALTDIEEAREYLNSRSFISEKLIFSSSLSNFECMALLMKNSSAQRDFLKKQLSAAAQLAKMVGTKRDYEFLNMRGIFSCYCKEAENCYYHFREAYHLFYQSDTGLFYEEKRMLLIDNIIIAFRILNMLEKAEEFIGKDVLEQSSQALTCSLDTWQAAGIQRTGDGLFNLPIL